MEADDGLFGPQSVAWRLHAAPAMLSAGLRALLLQVWHPLIAEGGRPRLTCPNSKSAP